MHHMGFTIVIKCVLCAKGGLCIDFTKVATFEKLSVFGLDMAVWNVIKQIARINSDEILNTSSKDIVKTLN